MDMKLEPLDAAKIEVYKGMYKYCDILTRCVAVSS